MDATGAIRLVEADSDAARLRVERLLRDAGLPTADLATSPMRLFLGYDDEATEADEADRLLGVGGLEIYGSDALLRSVAVPEDLRGRGIGATIYRALETGARDFGVERLYLLTTTAEGFFADRGFEVIDRAEAPEAVRETAEFEELCSSAATCMRKVVR